ncbi:unnamed protein product, partial [Rotaria magnacalcarata]
MEDFILKGLEPRRATLIWSQVSVTTSKKSNNAQQLLKNLSGIARSGEILAVMGASGA